MVGGNEQRYEERGGREDDERGDTTKGRSRQWAALKGAGGGVEELKAGSTAGCVVGGRDEDGVHGAAAVGMEGAVRGAGLQVHEGMGHLIAHELWPELAGGLLRTAARAEERDRPA